MHNVVVGTRCLNEERFIPLFLANHPFAEHIVICDGGSTDRSKELALADSRVVWVDFPERVPGKHGGWRNPEGAHVNATLEAMETLRPDWVWLTEMDAIPSRYFQEDAARFFRDLDNRGADLFSTNLLYLAPDGASHYPKLMQGPGYTAWRPGLGRATNLTDPFEGQGALRIDAKQHVMFDPPHGRIHFTFYSEEWVAKKAAFYREVHGWDFAHPDTLHGPREATPVWAAWRDPETGEWARSI